MMKPCIMQARLLDQNSTLIVIHEVASPSVHSRVHRQTCSYFKDVRPKTHGPAAL